MASNKSFGPDHPGVRSAFLRRGRVCVEVLTAAVSLSACALSTAGVAPRTCAVRFAYFEPLRVDRIGVESGAAVRFAEEDIRVLFEESPVWRIAPAASAADIVVRVEVDFWSRGGVRGVGGSVWTRLPASAEETLISEGATTYDPNFGGPGPPPEFWRTLLSPLVTPEPSGCARAIG